MVSITGVFSFSISLTLCIMSIKKAKKKVKKSKKYEQKLVVNGSFADVIKVAMSGNPVSKKNRG